MTTPQVTALSDANWKDAEEFCKGSFGHFVTDVSEYTKIVAELLQHATDRALAQPAPEAKLRKAERAVHIVGLIELLRSKEGDSVEILCDNPDFNGQPNCAVVCCGDWTGWEDRRFAADTVLDALSSAATEYNLPAPREIIAESNGHHWVQRFNLTCCRDCGIVRRADDQNSPCKGVVRVGPRAALSLPHGAGEAETVGENPNIYAAPSSVMGGKFHRPLCKLCGLEDGACICAHIIPSPALSPVTVERCAKVAENFYNITSTDAHALEFGKLVASQIAGGIRALLASPAPSGETFQSRVKPWMEVCFGPEISADRTERNHRFLEEALELVQACGCTQSEANQLVDYVYGRDQGDINQEVGGVMVTLAALCLANGFDMHAAGETELARIWTKVEQIRAKQAAKPKNSPLPAHPIGNASEAGPVPSTNAVSK